jgi:hypothetical protein
MDFRVDVDIFGFQMLLYQLLVLLHVFAADHEEILRGNEPMEFLPLKKTNEKAHANQT